MRGRLGSTVLLRQILTEEGIRGLWRGNMVNLTRVIPSYAVRLTVFGNLSQYGETVPLLKNTFVAGSLSGVVGALAAYPLEVLRTRLSVGSTLREGFRQGRLMAGCSLTVMDTVPYSALSLGTYGYLERRGDMSKFTCGLVAGAVATLVCFPIDTLRRYKIVFPHKPVREILLDLYHLEGGLYRFYRGLSIALLKAAPTVGITMALNDAMLEYLGVV
jgi:solute carrier family 25 (mitochondrial phosphate transporter), member 23/24/25/41